MTRDAVLSVRAGLMTWITWWSLLALQALDAWMLAAPWFIWLVKIAPLLLFLRGMLKGNLRSYIWLCFVCLGYFFVLVPRVFAQPDSVLVLGSLAAVVILFISAMLFVRWKARAQRAASGLSGHDD